MLQPVLRSGKAVRALARADVRGAVWGARRAGAAGDWPAVAAHCRTALQAEPDWVSMWLKLGLAQKHQGDFAAAEASYRRAVALDDRQAEAHRRLAFVLKLQRRYADAAASYFAAARLDPRSSARDELLALGYRENMLRDALSAGTLSAAPPLFCVEAAHRARDIGDWRQAAEHFTEALQADPEWASIWVQLGHAQKEMGDLATAEASYRRALELEPDDAETQLYFGHLKKAQGDHAAAEACYRRALVIDPNLADAHLQLGHLLKLLHRFDEAASCYFAAVRLAPTQRFGLYARGELITLGYRAAAIEAALRTGSLPWPPPGRGDAPAPTPPVFGIIGRYFPPVIEPGAALPVILRHPVWVPGGASGLFIDVQTVKTQALPPIEVSLVAADAELTVEAAPNGYGPNVLTYRIDAAQAAEGELVLRGHLPPDCVIRRIEIGSADNARVWPVPVRDPGPLELPTDQIRNFIIGTTGVCNASCPHCPTNKLVPSAQFASAMPVDLFDRLVDQIVDQRIFITGHISLGLFGDGLLDPHVVARASRLRAAFPHAPLHVNTNAAAYNRARHAALGSLIDLLAVHVETLDEEKYSRLMEPLRLKNVLPKIHQIIDDMAPIVSIASPMHRENIDELDSIKAYFAARGVHNTIFTPISNRCSRDELFQQMALGPTSGSCPEEIIFDLIVDWDGTVLVCCNDFLRQEPIGDLRRTPLPEILRGAKRQRVFDALRTGNWQEMVTCRNCKFDCGYKAAS